MSEIKVNTDDLRNNAAAFNTEARKLNATLAELLSVLNSINLGKYQSQLSDRVRLRVIPTQEVISGYQDQLQELAEKLNNKALEFEQANTASMSNVTHLSMQMYAFTNSSATMTASATLRKIMNQKSESIWDWGGNLVRGLLDWVTRFSTQDFDRKNTSDETPSLIRKQGLLDPNENISTNSTTPIEQAGLLEKDTKIPQTKKNKNERKYNPKEVPLTPGISPHNYDDCVKYAKARREGLGNADGTGAADYKNHAGVFQIDEEDKDLTSILAVGYALIWDRDPNHPPNAETWWSATTHADPINGHIAIIEEVDKDRIIVSHAAWTGSTRTEISITELRAWFYYIYP